MRNFSLIGRRITSSVFDAKAGQTLCWLASMFVMVGGIFKLMSLKLSEVEFFLGLMLIVTVSLLGIILGILLPIGEYVARANQRKN